MKRLFGMMPSSEIETLKSYRDQNGMRISIEAGQKGWTVLWGDYGTDFQDADKSPQENFQDAYDFVTSKGFILTEEVKRNKDDYERI